MRAGFIIYFFLLLCSETLAQPLDFLRADSSMAYLKLPRILTVSLKTQYGKVLPTDTPVLESSIELNPCSSGEVRLGFSSYGRKRWQEIHNYPDYGIGFYQCRLNPRDNPLGQPRSVYFYYNKSLLGDGSISLHYDFAIGMACNFIEYDPVDNPSQVAIGSEYNGHVSLGFEGRVRLTEFLVLGIGGNHTHFSNGRIRTPQRGINLLTLNGSLIVSFPDLLQKKSSGYSQKKSLPAQIRHKIPEFIPGWEFYLVANAGVATPEYNYKERDLVYSIFTASLAAARHYSHKGKIVAGLDIFSDESLSEEYGIPLEELSKKDRVYHGIQAGHELMVNRFTLVTQLGIPLDNRDVTGNWYGRIGMRIDITRNIFFRYALKLPDNWQSDYIEWGLGFNIYKWRDL